MGSLNLETLQKRIFLIRGQRIMLDSDLAAMYGVSTKALNQAVRRNRRRFPADFMFQLSGKEAISLRSQIVTSKIGQGGRRYRPLAFTEHGAVMLSAVLRSSAAVRTSIQIARAFVRLRRLILVSREFTRRLDQLEREVAGQGHKIIGLFDALRELTDGRYEERQIGFRP